MRTNSASACCMAAAVPLWPRPGAPFGCQLSLQSLLGKSCLQLMSRLCVRLRGKSCPQARPASRTEQLVGPQNAMLPPASAPSPRPTLPLGASSPAWSASRTCSTVLRAACPAGPTRPGAGLSTALCSALVTPCCVPGSPSSVRFQGPRGPHGPARGVTHGREPQRPQHGVASHYF